ncbi:MAG: orotate phosphoribosyltransferase [Gaiellaceae bacterium]
MEGRTLAERINRRCHLTGSFQLRSGQMSKEYFDKYLFETQPHVLREVSEVMVGLLPACDLLAGVELGGVPIATVMSQLTGLPTVFVRKQAKNYGTCKCIEGDPVEGQRVVVIEDVVTTGGALLQASTELRKAGAELDTAVCAVDREQGGSANLLAHGIQLRAALTGSDLHVAPPSNTEG